MTENVSPSLNPSHQGRDAKKGVGKRLPPRLHRGQAAAEGCLAMTEKVKGAPQYVEVPPHVEAERIISYIPRCSVLLI
ncbi:MAG: hypothetical protein CVU62_08510 [Deltaproteobacteria bacterium HGW-Deltaproteobacteria-2]|nr:MAG: hypothetical protein CVU62_08510 [Deltaproteobacteria bacterium HGW-Deltaproteobacteria-2]